MSALAFPKPSRLKDEAYLDWIRLRGCLVCGAAAHAHHSVHVSAGGSDYRALALCVRHHAECHRIGKQRFQDRYRLDFTEEVIRHLELYVSALKEGVA